MLLVAITNNLAALAGSLPESAADGNVPSDDLPQRDAITGENGHSHQCVSLEVDREFY